MIRKKEDEKGYCHGGTLHLNTHILIGTALYCTMLELQVGGVTVNGLDPKLDPKQAYYNCAAMFCQGGGPSTNNKICVHRNLAQYPGTGTSVK